MDAPIHALTFTCRGKQFVTRFIELFSRGDEDACLALIATTSSAELQRLPSRPYFLLWSRLVMGPFRAPYTLDTRRRLIGSMLDAGLGVTNILVDPYQSLLGFSKTMIWKELALTADMDQQHALQSFWKWLECQLVHHGALSISPPWKAHSDFEQRGQVLLITLDSLLHGAPNDILLLILSYDVVSMMARCMSFHDS